MSKNINRRRRFARTRPSREIWITDRVLSILRSLTVHLPNGFSSIKLLAVTAAGAQFGQPGYETDLLYLACLAALVLGGSGPLAIDDFMRKRKKLGIQDLERERGGHGFGHIAAGPSGILPAAAPRGSGGEAPHR
jgi:hypothetical protein